MIKCITNGNYNMLYYDVIVTSCKGKKYIIKTPSSIFNHAEPEISITFIYEL